MMGDKASDQKSHESSREPDGSTSTLWRPQANEPASKGKQTKLRARCAASERHGVTRSLEVLAIKTHENAYKRS